MSTLDATQLAGVREQKRRSMAFLDQGALQAMLSGAAPIPASQMEGNRRGPEEDLPTKQGYLNTLFPNAAGTWRAWYFITLERELFYWGTEEAAQSEEPQGSIDLELCQVVDASDEVGIPWVFKASHPFRPALLFEAADEADYREWTETLAQLGHVETGHRKLELFTKPRGPARKRAPKNTRKMLTKSTKPIGKPIKKTEETVAEALLQDMDLPDVEEAPAELMEQVEAVDGDGIPLPTRPVPKVPNQQGDVAPSRPPPKLPNDYGDVAPSRLAPRPPSDSGRAGSRSPQRPSRKPPSPTPKSGGAKALPAGAAQGGMLAGLADAAAGAKANLRSATEGKDKGPPSTKSDASAPAPDWRSGLKKTGAGAATPTPPAQSPAQPAWKADLKKTGPPSKAAPAPPATTSAPAEPAWKAGLRKTAGNAAAKPPQQAPSEPAVPAWKANLRKTSGAAPSAASAAAGKKPAPPSGEPAWKANLKKTGPPAKSAPAPPAGVPAAAEPAWKANLRKTSAATPTSASKTTAAAPPAEPAWKAGLKKSASSSGAPAAGASGGDAAAPSSIPAWKQQVLAKRKAEEAAKASASAAGSEMPAWRRNLLARKQAKTDSGALVPEWKRQMTEDTGAGVGASAPAAGGQKKKSPPRRNSSTARRSSAARPGARKSSASGRAPAGSIADRAKAFGGGKS